MAYLKPSALVSNGYNKLAMRFGLAGAETATVTGRKTGEPRSVPVIPVTVDGQLYMVSTRGEAEWVRNLRATPTVLITKKGRAQSYSAVEIPAEARGSVIAAYRAKAGREVNQYWKKIPDAADHPVFRLTPDPS
jgi:deazaflavin-dependent oxidoreductase (nitroreductase family)